MSSNIALPDPANFGLSSFADLLPPRDTILGEVAGSYQEFHDALMRTLVPFTAYECVIAENLIAIEWELVQHRTMRDARVRQQVRESLCDEVVRFYETKHQAAVSQGWADHAAAGKDEEDYDEPLPFDRDAAARLAEDLAVRAVSSEPEIHAKAYDDLAALGMHPIEMMSAAYLGGASDPVPQHEQKIQDLERRRREVKRDYDALQRSRPLDAEFVTEEGVPE